MLDKLPDEILWNILTRLDPIEQVLTTIPRVCRAWNRALDGDQTRFWIGLTELHGIKVGKRQQLKRRRRRNTNAKRTFFKRKRETDQALRLETDQVVWEIWKRLRKKDCVGWVRKRIASHNHQNEQQSKGSDNDNDNDNDNNTLNNSVSIVHHPVRGLERRTLLHLACWCGRTNTVRMLLEQQGASRHVVDDWNATPLLIAAWDGHEGVVRLLLEKQLLFKEEKQTQQKDDDDDNGTHTHKEEYYYLNLPGVPPLTSSCGGRGPKTAICWAERKGHESIVRLLERAGADTSHRRPSRRQE
jgi:hypothetical protein